MGLHNGRACIHVTMVAGTHNGHCTFARALVTAIAATLAMAVTSATVSTIREVFVDFSVRVPLPPIFRKSILILF